jgi:hypothetical protein
VNFARCLLELEAIIKRIEVDGRSTSSTNSRSSTSGWGLSLAVVV